MLLWFAGASVVIVWAVFQSPALDYRLVMVGSVAPILEGLSGRPLVLHTLVGAAAALTLVMLATRGRRLVRRRWIGLPIGLLLHLVLDGIWTRAEVFWWPFFGVAFSGPQIPELARGPVLPLVLELVGALCLVWSYRRFGLADPERRRVFLETGRLDRTVAG